MAAGPSRAGAWDPAVLAVVVMAVNGVGLSAAAAKTVGAEWPAVVKPAAAALFVAVVKPVAAESVGAVKPAGVGFVAVAKPAAAAVSVAVVKPAAAAVSVAVVKPAVAAVSVVAVKPAAAAVSVVVGAGSVHKPGLAAAVKFEDVPCRDAAAAVVVKLADVRGPAAVVAVVKLVDERGPAAVVVAVKLVDVPVSAAGPWPEKDLADGAKSGGGLKCSECCRSPAEGSW